MYTNFQNLSPVSLVVKVTKVFIGKMRAKKLCNYKSQASITGATKVLELTSKMKIQKKKEGNERKEEDLVLPLHSSLLHSLETTKSLKPIHHDLSRTTKTLNPKLFLHTLFHFVISTILLFSLIVDDPV